MLKKTSKTQSLGCLLSFPGCQQRTKRSKSVGVGICDAVHKSACGIAPVNNTTHLAMHHSI
jgi:hypothetical protein